MLASTRDVFFLTVFAGATLLHPASPATFAQTRGNNESVRSAQIERADHLLEEALRLSGSKDRELARERLREAMQLWIQASQPAKAAQAALQMGDSYKEGRRPQEALYCYEQVLAISPPDAQARVNAFNSIAKVYADLFQRGLALRYYNQAIKLAQSAGYKSGRVLALTGLADLYHREGNRPQALACVLEARRLSLRNESVFREAVLAHLSGQIEMEEGRIERALQDFEEALTLYAKASDEDGQIKVMCSISDLYLASGRTPLAIEEADRAVELATRQAARATNNSGVLRGREARGRAWLSYARARRAAGEKDIAINSYLKALFQLEGLYWSVYVATEGSAIAFREEIQAPYRELADLLIEQGRSQEAFVWTEHSKARAMLGMAEARLKMKSRSKIDEEGRLQALSERIARRRAQLGANGLTERERMRLEANLTDARDAMDEARSKLEMERSRSRVVWFQPATVVQLQERMARTGEVMLEFRVGENHSYAWLLASGDISFEILPGRKELEKQFRAMDAEMSAPPGNLLLERSLSKVTGAGEQLFSTLLGRLYEHIPRGSKLIIVPDGVLHYLPFEALVHDGRYLVEDHEISYVPSLSMLNLWQDSKEKAVTEDKMEIVAFGDPKVGGDHKRSRAKESRSSKRGVPTQTRASRGFHLAPLPRTRDEVQNIAQLFPSGRQRVYLGKDATEGAVKRESLRRFRRVHFATHSLIDDVSPSRSAVVLSLDGDQKEDGFLEASEISELDFDCDLVVLSACQTGRGKVLSGEGIVGLSHAFLYAGARAVVVSLWDVSDISTSHLMERFYQRLNAGMGNAAALRETKLRMLKSDNETRHPYYWAPFVIVGKP